MRNDRRTALLAAVAAAALGVAAATGSAVPSGAPAVLPAGAAAYLQARDTAIVAVVALVTSLLAGVAAGEFAEPAHIAGLLAVALAGAASVLGTLERQERDRDGERLAYLAEATGVLASSIDYEGTARTAASLPVPWLADWCALDLIEPGGGMRRRAVSHKESGVEEISWRLAGGSEEDPEPGPREALRTAHAELWPEIPDSLFEALARDEEHLRDLRSLGAGSAMIVPLRTVDRTLGVMTLGARAKGRFSTEDLAFAQDLARRCAGALVVAEQYRDAMRGAGGRFSRDRPEGQRSSPPPGGET